MKKLFLLFLGLGLSACSFNSSSEENIQVHAPEKMKYSEAELSEFAVATFAGGCFWCTEADFEKVPGVKEAISGYAGGPEVNPTYEEVSRGQTGHYESVQVYYDSNEITYEEILEIFWKDIDPTDDGGQFVDRGNQYKTAIFYHDAEQRAAAEESLAELEASGRYDESIVTEIRALEMFYPAEEYHQDFYIKDPKRYDSYRSGSGRDKYLKEIWGDELHVIDGERYYYRPNQVAIREMLTDLQYRVTQQDDTEPPFENEYWDNEEAGIYVDIVSGEPLFSSLDKFESGTGWPSFTKPLEPDNIRQDVDHKLGYPRDEIRSKYANSHLGHVFEDGPEPTGLRYCMNSAALRFIPAEDLAAEGYEQYTELFSDASN